MSDYTQYDVAIIGSGPGGYVAAIRLGQRGKKVALIEKEKVGGVCLNWGCIPSKALIQASRLVEKIKHASAIGIHVENVSVNFAELIGWKDTVVKQLTGGIQQLLKQHNVTVISGHASFETHEKIKITRNDSVETIIARNTIIATGSSISKIPSLPVDHQSIIDSTSALALSEIPKSMAIIGGGIIGLELGMMYHQLGCEITIIEMLPDILADIDADIVQTFKRILKKEKITLHLGTKVTHCVAGKTGVELTLENTTTKETQILSSEKVLVCIGRHPNTDGIHLEYTGVECDEKGFIKTDNQSRTTIRNIFAIGDVTGTPFLAHKASKEALIAADAICGQATIKDYQALPSAIFTTPEIATVGLSEAQAISRGYTVKTGSFPFAASGRAMTMRETAGLIKVITDAETDIVLGVHMIGPDVSEIIAEAALAIEVGATSEDLALTIHAHPTLPESLMEAAEAVHKQAIHYYQKK